MTGAALDVNELLQLVQDRRALGDEQLYAVAQLNGRAVRFAVVAVNQERHELELVLEPRSWEGPPR